MAETLTAFGLVEHLWGRIFEPPRGEARYPRMSSPLRRPFRTSDGWISVVVYSDQNWMRFFEMIGLSPSSPTSRASRRLPRVPRTSTSSTRSSAST